VNFPCICLNIYVYKCGGSGIPADLLKNLTPSPLLVKEREELGSKKQNLLKSLKGIHIRMLAFCANI